MRKFCVLALTALALIVSSCGPKGQELQKGADVVSAKVTGYAVMSTTVDPTAKVITYTVPGHAKAIDFVNLEAEFAVSEGASWALKTGSEINWLAPEFTIVVTSQSQNEKNEYRVVRAYDYTYGDKSVGVVNTYTGIIDITINGVKEPLGVSQKIALSRMSSSVTSVLLKNFKFGAINVGNVQVDSIGVFSGTKDGEFILSGVDSTTVNIGTEINVKVGVFGSYDSKVDRLELSIEIGGVSGLEISAEFEGMVFNDETATQPIFISVAGSNLMGAQDFKDGDLTYYGDGSLDKSAFADVVPKITLPVGATMKWDKDKPFDPTATVQYFDVTSSDKSQTKQYSITRDKVNFNNVTKYSFEEWTENSQEAPYITYYDPKPEALQEPNFAVLMIKALGDPEMYPADGIFPVSPESNGKVGKAARLITIDTKGGILYEGGPITPKVTSGSLFVGKFDFWAAMEDAMLTTQFGLPYNGKKINKVKGWYKYTPGAQMYNNMNPIAGTDKPIISCIVYDISDNYKFTLTGRDTYTSPRIVGVGKINPAVAANFTEFTVDVTYTKPFTPSKNNVYKVALITSASADGDRYIGAPGSVLIVDEIELVTE